ncbi:MAG: nitrous oxide reductase family maturation protein NosD, partial [Solirubrobacteraceae bacterium]
MTGFRCPPVRANRLLLALAVCAITAIAPCGVALASGQNHHGDDHHGHGNGHHGHGNQGTLFVSSSGSSGGAGYSCATANYSTIQSAVDAAPAGGTVIVCPGTYTENVVISQPLKLQGLGATVHGASTNTIMCDQLGPKGPGSALCLAAITIKSSWVQVRGFTVTGAIGEGILATGSLQGGSISNVSITGNRVANNDLGGIPPTTSSPYPQCVEVGEIPGDCGEGIHLMGAYNSVVSGNDVTGNSGGVLLTDEFGPTHHNLVAGNVIKDNLFDCGVTVPGHNPNALDKSGNRQPAMAGDYDNVIAGNWITGNGVKGEGAGVLFANAAPGSASYDNLVIHNFIAGNELAGVTLHAHP